MSRPKSWPWILLLISLAFVQRAGIVLAPKAHLYGQPARGELRIRVGEEIARGNVAVDLLEGPILPLMDYQYAHFFGGSLVIGILTVPAFALFGPRLWALKLVPVLVHLAGLLLLFRLLDRHVSRRAALFGGLLYALTPPGYAQLSTVAWGSHIESNTLALAALSLYLDLRGSERPLRRRFALGLVLGFGLYFGYQFALVIVALAFFDLSRRGRPSGRELVGQLLGMAVGFTPWLIYNLGADFAGLAIYARGISGHLEQSGAGPKLVHLVTAGLPGALFMGSRGVELAVALLLASLALVGIRKVAGPARVAGVYGALFMVACALSDFRIGDRPEAVTTYRYAMLLAPWVAIAVACGLDSIAGQRGRATALAWSLALALALLFWVTSWAVSCDAGRFGADRDAPGADLASHGRWLCMKLLDKPARIPALVESIVERRDEQDQRILFDAMGGFLLRMGRERARANERRREEAKRMRYASAVYLAEVPTSYKDAFRR